MTHSKHSFWIFQLVTVVLSKYLCKWNEYKWSSSKITLIFLSSSAKRSLPVSVLMHPVIGVQLPIDQDWAKSWAELSMIPLKVVKSSLVSLLKVPQRPRIINGKIKLYWLYIFFIWNSAWSLRLAYMNLYWLIQTFGIFSRWQIQVYLNFWRDLNLHFQAKWSLNLNEHWRLPKDCGWLWNKTQLHIQYKGEIYVLKLMLILHILSSFYMNISNLLIPKELTSLWQVTDFYIVHLYAVCREGISFLEWK